MTAEKFNVAVSRAQLEMLASLIEVEISRPEIEPERRAILLDALCVIEGVYATYVLALVSKRR